MAKARRMPKRKDRRVFEATYNRTKAINRPSGAGKIRL